MADHIITLTDRHERGLSALLAEQQETQPDLTAETLLRSWVLFPIRQKLTALDAAKVAPIVEALPNATTAQLTQIKTLLGI